MSWFSKAKNFFSDAKDAVASDPLMLVAPFSNPSTFKKLVGAGSSLLGSLMGGDGAEAPTAVPPPAYEPRKTARFEVDSQERRRQFFAGQFGRQPALTSSLSVGRKSLLGA